MFAFYLSADTEEIGGGTVLIANNAGRVLYTKQAFPKPQIALAPAVTTDISSWSTGPITGKPTIVDGEGKYVLHQNRTPWGSEVFTVSILPENLSPPVRFFRMPVADPAIFARNGGDDIWIWGRSGTADFKAIPLFFDHFGTVLAGWDAGSSGPVAQTSWLSTSATRCPPVGGTEVTLGMEHTYQTSSGPYQVLQWNIAAQAKYQDGLAGQTPPFIEDPLPLTGRMCQTSGYQDGQLYRARPYAFADVNSTEQTTLPAGILNVLNFSSSGIQITDLQSMAVALSSDTNYTYQQAIPIIGVGGIQAMLGDQSLATHPTIPGFFGTADSTLIWVGSEANAPILPGGYRIVSCPGTPRAVPFVNISGSYPVQCADFGLTSQGQDRQTMPIIAVYRKVSGTTNFLEVHMYNISLTRGASGYSAKLNSDRIIGMNGGLALMNLTSTSSTPSLLSSGYPGSLGGPVFVYGTCST
jgi:hypothetical protein